MIGQRRRGFLHPPCHHHLGSARTAKRPRRSLVHRQNLPHRMQRRPHQPRIPALTRFDKIIGLDRLRALHLNDSLFDLGCGKDRHARIGEGFIGFEAIYRIAHHPAFAGLPMILETPNEPPEHGEEIKLLLQR